MLYTIFNIIYVLVAIAMTALILLQQGSGASAGASFGSGASGTVFGARGSANFMSKSTAVLAAVFFMMSLGMAIYLHKTAGSGAQLDEAGLMGSAMQTTSTQQENTSNSEIPQADPAPAAEEVPVQAPVEATPVEAPDPEPTEE